MEVPVFNNITLDEFAQSVAGYKERGWRFSNLCGSTVGDKVELLCSFVNGGEVENLSLLVERDEPVAAVSTLFPSAFLYENETHDLFGVKFDGMILDFGGKFYPISVPTPMNPHSSEAEAFLASSEGEEVTHG